MQFLFTQPFTQKAQYISQTDYLSTHVIVYLKLSVFAAKMNVFVEVFGYGWAHLAVYLLKF